MAKDNSTKRGETQMNSCNRCGFSSNNLICESCVSGLNFNHKDECMQKLKEWAYQDRNKRKEARFEYTASPERDIAYRIQDLENRILKSKRLGGVAELEKLVKRQKKIILEYNRIGVVGELRRGMLSEAIFTKEILEKRLAELKKEKGLI